MGRYTAFIFVMILGLAPATVASAFDQPSDTSPAPSLENDNPPIGTMTGAGETPTIDGVTMPDTMFENLLSGEIINIDGEFFVIKDQAGREVRIIVDDDTLLTDDAEDSDTFKAGDTIEAELTPGRGQSGDRASASMTAEDYPHAKSFRVLGTGLVNPRPQ